MDGGKEGRNQPGGTERGGILLGIMDFPVLEEVATFACGWFGVNVTRCLVGIVSEGKEAKDNDDSAMEDFQLTVSKEESILVRLFLSVSRIFVLSVAD